MLDGSNGITLDRNLSLGGNYGVKMEGTGYARMIRNTIIEGALQQAVYLGDTTSRVTIAGSWLGFGGPNPFNGTMRGVLIQPEVRHVIISANLIVDQFGPAIESLGSFVTINGNEFRTNYNPDSASVKITSGSHITITSNTWAENTEADSVRLLNTSDWCIVTSNMTQKGVNDLSSGAKKQIANNL